MAKLNLYKVSRKNFEYGWHYDQYDEFIVAAKNKRVARYTMPDSTFNTGENESGDWVSDVSELTVKLIGIADEKYTSTTVIMSSFRAG